MALDIIDTVNASIDINSATCMHEAKIKTHMQHIEADIEGLLVAGLTPHDIQPRYNSLSELTLLQQHLLQLRRTNATATAINVASNNKSTNIKSSGGDDDLVALLTEMGFDKALSIRAANHSTDVDACLDYLSDMHSSETTIGETCNPQTQPVPVPVPDGNLSIQLRDDECWRRPLCAHHAHCLLKDATPQVINVRSRLDDDARSLVVHRCTRRRRCTSSRRRDGAAGRGRTLPTRPSARRGAASTSRRSSRCSTSAADW